MSDQAPPVRRTKRRYAHELYPHAKEGEIRPLSVEVPYLYAQALGFDVGETGWMEADQAGRIRIRLLCEARLVALLADASHQGLTGDAAWRWVCEHMDDSGELIWDRAVHYGVDADRIKPYPCGPAPEGHMHPVPDMPGARTWRRGSETECERCTEPADPLPLICNEHPPLDASAEHHVSYFPEKP